MTNIPKSDRPKVNITEHSLLVSPSKSKKLAAIANKRASVTPPNPIKTNAIVSSAKSELEKELEHAQNLIDTRINDIMESFPQGKRLKLFSFRYGSVDDIKAMPIPAAFKRLAIHVPINNRLVDNRNYHGDTV